MKQIQTYQPNYGKPSGFRRSTNRFISKTLKAGAEEFGNYVEENEIEWLDLPAKYPRITFALGTGLLVGTVTTVATYYFSPRKLMPSYILAR